MHVAGRGMRPRADRLAAALRTLCAHVPAMRRLCTAITGQAPLLEQLEMQAALAMRWGGGGRGEGRRAEGSRQR